MPEERTEKVERKQGLSEAQQKKVAEGDGGAAEVQERMDEINEQGFMGTKVDPTPNENYTVEGNDLPTPETDPKLAAKARAHSEQLARGTPVEGETKKER